MNKATVSILEVMNLALSDKVSTLPARRSTSLKLEAHSRIQCTGGKLWVTRDGDPRDYVLVEGESLSLDRPARLVLSGLGQASYRIG